MKIQKEELLARFVEYAKSDDNIRALILEGSSASNKKTDEFSDYDLSVISKEPEKLLNDNSWYENIEDIMVCLPLSFKENSTEIHVRLAMYDGGAKIDYGIYPIKYVTDIIKSQKLTQRYRLGYEVLLDKDNMVKFPKADHKLYPVEKISQEEFFRWVNTFFYEASQMPMYLVREDLWHNKLRDWTLKEYTLRILELSEKVKNGWDYNVGVDGKKMKSWLSSENYKLIKDTFGRFDKDDSWKSLFATLKAFSKIGKETAELLGYQYPEEMDRGVSEYVTEVYNKYK